MSERLLSGRLPARHGPPGAVVEQGVDGSCSIRFSLLTMISGAQVEQPLQPVVAVDHPAVESFRSLVANRTVELDHRPQLGRDDRDDVKDHGRGR